MGLCQTLLILIQIDINQLFHMIKRRKIIGEIMVSLGYVTLEHVNRARWQQMQGTAKRLGECLVELGHTTHDDVCRALQIQELDPNE